MRTLFGGTIAAICYFGFASAIPLVNSTNGATIDSSIRRASAQILVQDANSQLPPFVDVLNVSTSDEAPGTEDYFAAASVADAVAGTAMNRYDGSASAAVNSMFVPTNPGLGNQFHTLLIPQIAASSSVQQTDVELDSETNGSATVFVHFTLSRPTKWSFSGHFLGSATGGAQSTAGFGIIDVNDTPGNFIDSFILSGTFNQFVSRQGVLPAGSYEIAVVANATNVVEFIAGGGNALTGIVDARFVVPEPQTAAIAALLLFIVSAQRVRLSRRTVPRSFAS